MSKYIKYTIIICAVVQIIAILTDSNKIIIWACGAIIILCGVVTEGIRFWENKSDTVVQRKCVLAISLFVILFIAVTLLAANFGVFS